MILRLSHDGEAIYSADDPACCSAVVPSGPYKGARCSLLTDHATAIHEAWAPHLTRGADMLETWRDPS